MSEPGLSLHAELVAMARESTARAGAGFIASYALSFLGLGMALFVPIQVLLAQQMEQIVPANKVVALGWVTGIGAFVSAFAGLICGAWSDRTTSRWGRRLPWSVGSAIAGACALVVLGRQHSLWGVTIAWCAVQFTLSAMLTALMAVLPDCIPVPQRAMCSAWTAIAGTLGIVLGTLLVTVLVSGIDRGYIAIATALVLCMLPFALGSRPGPSERPFQGTKKSRDILHDIWTLRDLWTNPHRYRNLNRAWWMIFLVQLGSAMGTVFLLYFLRDAVHFEQIFPGRKAEQGLLLLVLVYTAGVTVGALFSGYVSDRTQRRKRNILFATLLMSASALALALWPFWLVMVGAAASLGLGYGAYVAAEQALISQILPSPDAFGKDLGIFNIASSMPLVLAPAIAALLVTHLEGYTFLYLSTAVITAGGGWLATGVRERQ